MSIGLHMRLHSIQGSISKSSNCMTSNSAHTALLDIHTPCPKLSRCQITVKSIKIIGMQCCDLKRQISLPVAGPPHLLRQGSSD